MNKSASLFTYEMTYERAGNSLRAIYTRSDGLQTKSTWWEIDDGSAESEAVYLLSMLEKKELESKASSGGVTHA